MIRGFFKTVLPLAFAAACVVAGMGLLKVASRPSTAPMARHLPLVRVRVAAPADTRFDVQTFGVVHPTTETTLVARVQGNVEYVSPSFTEGGSFEKGELLVRIDRRDYELRRVEAAAVVAEAQAVHDRIRAESEVAKKEWKAFGKGEAEPLALREPQLAEALAKLEAAKARLAAADLDLERTEIRAPYAGRVRKKSVDIGQFVGAGTPVGVVFGTESAEIRLPVTDDQLAFLSMPVGEGEGPEVTISASLGGEGRTWPGRIVRTESEVDPRTRVLYAVARVDHPYGEDGGAASPLLPGMFVEAVIRGKTLKGVTSLPERALRPGDRVLVVAEGDQLAWRPVQVLRSVETGTIAVAGLEAGERVCLSDPRPVVEGMKVRVAEDPEAPR